MANLSAGGAFFERVAIQSSIFPAIIQTQLVSLSLSDNQYVDFARTMTADHINAGVIRGNSEGRAVISIYNRTDTAILDLRGYDFDNALLIYSYHYLMVNMVIMYLVKMFNI